jgi:hypothetical protein
LPNRVVDARDITKTMHPGRGVLWGLALSVKRLSVEGVRIASGARLGEKNSREKKQGADHVP